MKHRLNTDGNNSAFTLVELLVVIAIIGTLAALLLPALARSKQKSQLVRCGANLHQLGIGLQVILSNEHAYPMFQSGRYSGWEVQLQEQGLDQLVQRAPSGAIISLTNFFGKGVWLCPAAHYPPRQLSAPLFSCYGYNAFGALRNRDLTNFPNSLGLCGHVEAIFSKSFPFLDLEGTPILESEVVNPSDLMAIGDSFDGRGSFDRTLQDQDEYGNLNRHQGKANVVFCDGHVESPTLKFLFEDTSDAALVRWNRDHLPHREKLSP
jgi:prepilin-type processing-associated H-X9-DG protein/prepilin-type N-terminal cleavage/methylation domain-containing protein